MPIIFIMLTSFDKLRIVSWSLSNYHLAYLLHIAKFVYSELLIVSLQILYVYLFDKA